MITQKSLPLLTERYTKSPKENTTKYNTLFPKQRYNNTHEHHTLYSNIIKVISTKRYNPDKNQTIHSIQGDFLNNSSFVIKYLSKRSTEDFPNYVESDYNSSNFSHRSKLKNNLNTIDRMDIDEKKLNNSNLPTNNATTKTNSGNSEKLGRTNLVTTFVEGSRNVSFKFTNQTNSHKSTNESNGVEILGGNNKNTTKGKKPINNVREYYTPPGISRKNVTICVILVFCVMIAVGINFINLSSDFDDLMEFYRGFMGRRLLIVEGRLTSRSHILLLKAKEQVKLEVGSQVKSISFTFRKLQTSSFFVNRSCNIQ